MKTISFASIFFMTTIFFVTPQMSLSQELPTLLVFTSNAGPIDKTEYSLYWRNLSNSVSWRFVTALRGSDIWRVEQADCGDGSDNVWFTDQSSVYKARYDGGQITNLLPQSSPRELDLSPDLQQIVVSASGQVPSGPELIVLPSRGAGDAQITQNVSIERYPQWSPNASSVAYVIPSLQDEPLNYKVAVHDLTSGITQIIFETGSYLSDLDWSPDGTTFVFTSDMGGDLDIYSIGVDGTGLTALTSGEDWDLNPKWSLDGSQIAFSSKRDGDGLQIFLMDADGANPTRITDTSFANSDNYMQCWMRPEHHLPVAVPQVTVQSIQGDEGIVLLDGSSSYDPDGSVADYLWSDGWQQQIAIGPTAVVSMSVGQHLVYLEVIDSQGLQGIGWMRVDIAAADSADPGG
ncbi:MAG: PD40 domain-containing protein [Chloroflexi bacterium]|nr:PD40 domain-containing protein [Chloroflexota bacterium]